MAGKIQSILIGIIIWVISAVAVVAADKENTVVFKGQENLKKLGYYNAEVDGLLGPETQKAIIQFQLEMNLSVTSILDEATIKSLNRPSLVLNTQDFAPFHYNSAQLGGVGGPIPQIIKLTCHKAGLNCRIVMYENWKRAQDDAKEGKADGLFVLAWNSEREEWLYRSAAIIETEYGLFVHKDDPMQMAGIVKQPSMLEEYTISVYGPSGTSSSLKRFKTVLEGKGARLYIEEEPDDKPLFKKLSSSKGKYAVYSNKIVGETIISGMKFPNIRYAGKHKDLTYYVGFSKKQVPIAVVEQFNKAYSELQKNGTIVSVLANHRMLSKSTPQDTSQSVVNGKPTEETESLHKVSKVTLNGVAVVVDSNNCLMWQISGSENYVNWDDAFSYIEKLNEKAHAGYTDWRLPEIGELSTLIEKELQRKNRMYINPVFDSLQQVCWSSDKSDMGVQYVDFFDGAKGTKDTKDTNFVRAVRTQNETECCKFD